MKESESKKNIQIIINKLKQLFRRKYRDSEIQRYIKGFELNLEIPDEIDIGLPQETYEKLIILLLNEIEKLR